MLIVDLCIPAWMHEFEALICACIYIMLVQSVYRGTVYAWSDTMHAVYKA